MKQDEMEKKIENLSREARERKNEVEKLNDILGQRRMEQYEMEKKIESLGDEAREAKDDANEAREENLILQIMMDDNLVDWKTQKIGRASKRGSRMTKGLGLSQTEQRDRVSKRKAKTARLKKGRS